MIALSQEDLAAACGLEQSYISMLERGSRTPGLDVFSRLAGALKIKPTTLLRDIGREMRETGGSR